MRYIHSQESLTIPDDGEPHSPLPTLPNSRLSYGLLSNPRIQAGASITNAGIPVQIRANNLDSQDAHQIKNDHCGGSSRYAKCNGGQSRGPSNGSIGKLVKDMSHLSVCFSHSGKNVINIELHHGARKNVATLRTVKSIINNLIIGVTRGFKYKMRYVYAHFPINVNIEKNSESGLFDVEIRYVQP